MFQVKASHVGVLAALPLCIALFCIFGPFETETVYRLSGVAYDVRPGPLGGYPTIDSNAGWTSFALGKRAALDILSGHWPLWNFYEGLGTPLLGGMQSAALFPPTLLLALPHGQEIEQGVLQFIAGLGAYLFFRRYGLGVTAALTGALLYELNGVFAWLRNAIFNPVAFLPWLFLTLESLRACAGKPIRERLVHIALGALAAALAVYAGFPEEVYFYTMLLVLWAGYRLAGLPRHTRPAFVMDLVTTAALALALSAPVLVAFVVFLKDAITGSHDVGFYGIIPHPATMLQYLAPYVYGPIFLKPISDTWPNIGGYTGYGLAIAALAGLWVGEGRWTKAILAAWIVIAVGVSHGVPGLYQAFMALPLAKIAAGSRYLNISWMFCVIFLAALFIDHIPSLSQMVLRRVMLRAAAAGTVLAAAAATAAWPLVAELWNTGDGFPGWEAAGFAMLAVISGALILAAYLSPPGQAARVMAFVLVAEALIWFGLPFLSHPVAARIDEGAIAFLQTHAGYQRIAGTNGQGLGPNYGSAFGIANLNYLDLPVPKATVAYVARRLDPTVTMDFMPPTPGETERLALFRAKAEDYARAGVKYVLADLAYNARPFVRTAPGERRLHYLNPGESFEVSATSDERTVAGVMVPLGERSRNADGVLRATFCSGADCAHGTAEIRLGQTNFPLFFGLDKTIEMAAGGEFTLRVERADGAGRIALALQPAPGAAGTQTGFAPELTIVAAAQDLPVYAGPRIAIYELPGTRGYFSAAGCALQPRTRNRVTAVCDRAATLTRLELYMDGWSAQVNGVNTPLGQEDATFQTVELPEGTSDVTFDYTPRGFGAALAAAAAALVLVMAIFAAAWRSSYNRNRFALYQSQ